MELKAEGGKKTVVNIVDPSLFQDVLQVEEKIDLCLKLRTKGTVPIPIKSDNYNRKTSVECKDIKASDRKGKPSMETSNQVWKNERTTMLKIRK